MMQMAALQEVSALARAISYVTVVKINAFTVVEDNRLHKLSFVVHYGEAFGLQLANYAAGGGAWNIGQSDNTFGSGGGD